MNLALALPLLLAAAAPPLPRSAPEAQGIPSAAILAFVEAAEAKNLGVHSVMVLRHGHVVAEGWWAPYGKDDPHMLYSLSKSFTSTAVGIAVAERKLTLDDHVLASFPDPPADPSQNLMAMRLRDLLTMSTGHHAEDVERGFSFGGDEVLTKAFLALPVAHKPGTHFWYNTPATYMASAMVQKATGEKVVDYLKSRLFDPLGITGQTWEESKQGVTVGGYGLKIKTEDIARFGQLYLQKGLWNGQRLLPADWVAAATARQTSNGSAPTSDWEQGYGYQFWRCRHGLYRGDGAFGQYCIVMPEQDAVVAITSGTRDMGAIMNLVWDHILAGMKPKALPADAPARKALSAKLASLAMPVQPGDANVLGAASYLGRTYAFPKNDDGIEAIALQSTAEGITLRITQNGRETEVPCGQGAWKRGGTLNVTSGAQPVAASGAWTAHDTYTARLWMYESPFQWTLTLRFEGDALHVDVEQNVGHGTSAGKHPTVVGRLRAS
ncbi:MAG: serine hydrolase domain-containing protein [Vicinamibacteria bacterium]